MIPMMTMAETVQFSSANMALNFLVNKTDCAVHMTSTDRTIKHNKAVGGAKNSYHLKNDQAIDFVPTVCKLTLEQFGNIACKYVSTIVYKHHIHIDIRKNKLCIKGKY